MNQNSFTDSFVVELITRKVINSSEFALYLHLCEGYEKAILNNELYTPKQKHLAKAINCRQPNICTMLKKLHEIGLIDYRNTTSQKYKSCAITRRDLVLKSLLH